MHGREITAGRDRQNAAVLLRKAYYVFLREVDHEFLGHGIGQSCAEELALLVLWFPGKRQQPVIEVRLIPCLKRFRPLVRLRHGIGSDRGKIDHHAVLGQNRIKRLNHIDCANCVDFDDIFRPCIARRHTGGVDDLLHAAQRCSIVCQCLHLCAICNVSFAKIALHTKLVQLRLGRLHFGEISSGQHDRGRLSKLLADRFSHTAMAAGHDRDCFLHV